MATRKNARRAGRVLLSNGLVYKSQHEQNMAQQLLKARIPFEYEKETFTFNQRIQSAICGACDSADVYKIRRYTPDFFLPKEIIIEGKGTLDRETRTMLVAFKKAYPKMDLRLLFMRNNLIYRGSKTRYTDWATKQGFPSAVGTIPKEWLDECRSSKRA